MYELTIGRSVYYYVSLYICIYISVFNFTFFIKKRIILNIMFLISSFLLANRISSSATCLLRIFIGCCYTERQVSVLKIKNAVLKGVYGD